MAKRKRGKSANKDGNEGWEDGSYGWAMAGQMRRAIRRERMENGHGYGYRYGHRHTDTYRLRVRARENGNGNGNGNGYSRHGRAPSHRFRVGMKRGKRKGGEGGDRMQARRTGW